MTELAALVECDRDYRQSSLICVTESWLTAESTGIDLEGFTTIRFDRDKGKTEKSVGGGLCIFVNDSWASYFCVRETVSTKRLQDSHRVIQAFLPATGVRTGHRDPCVCARSRQRTCSVSQSGRLSVGQWISRFLF